MKYIWIFLLPVLLIQSCKKDVNPENVDFGYEYFPMTPGSYRIYLVDSIGHDLTSDTSSYQIMEVLGEEFTDAIGQPAIEVERYKRFSSSEDWVLQQVWVQKRTTRSGERVEDNQRYIRMIFPIEDGKTWNGNAYNVYSDWMYTFQGVGSTRMVGPFTFQNTLKVNQRNNVNLIDQEIAEEIYAKDIGLIYKKLIDLNFQTDGLTGIELEMSIIGYGQNQ